MFLVKMHLVAFFSSETDRIGERDGTQYWEFRPNRKSPAPEF